MRRCIDIRRCEARVRCCQDVRCVDVLQVDDEQVDVKHVDV